VESLDEEECDVRDCPEFAPLSTGGRILVAILLLAAAAAFAVAVAAGNPRDTSNAAPQRTALEGGSIL
jgi:hypothetical protein